MPRFGVRYRGLDRLRARLRARPGEYERAAGATLYVEAEKAMTEAKRETPVDTGVLRASGHVALPETHGRTVSVELGFGGPAVGYATRVHEDLAARHEVGKAKYLEDPVKRRRIGFGRRFADGVRRRLGRG